MQGGKHRPKEDKYCQKGNKENQRTEYCQDKIRLRQECTILPRGKATTRRGQNNAKKLRNGNKRNTAKRIEYCQDEIHRPQESKILPRDKTTTATV